MASLINASKLLYYQMWRRCVYCPNSTKRHVNVRLDMDEMNLTAAERIPSES